jgi:hypothetical protein
VSVNTQPRSAPLRLFFFSWVCYSVAISTVFQAYLTTFLIEPGYEEPLKNIDQMLKSERKFGFIEWNMKFFTNATNSVDLAILKNAVRCPDEDTCFMWATVYHNISTLLDDIFVEYFHQQGYWWADEYYRPLLCELEDGVVTTYGNVLVVKNGRFLLELINDVIFRVVEGGILMQTKEHGLYKQKMDSKFIAFTSTDTYNAMSIRNLQTVFYVLLLGYVSALACFVTEIVWHCCRSKEREPSGTSVPRIDLNRHNS